MAGEAVFDKLIFALDGDLTALKARYAEAEAGAQKTGTNIQKNLGSGFKDAAKEANQHARQINLALNDIGESSKRIGNNIAVSRREMVYFVREMVNGDWQRAPATIALLASHMLEIPGAAIAATAAIVAIPVAVAVAAVKAENALAKLRVSLALTGYYAGISSVQAAGIAGQIAGGGMMSANGARGFVSGALGGFVPSGSIAQAGMAAGNFQLATGAKSEETQRLLREMFEDPSKAAQELNNSMRLLTTEQTQQVHDLQQQGQLERAGQIVLDAFNSRVRDAAQQASVFEKALDRAGTRLGNIWSALGKLFGGGTTDADTLASLKNQRDQIAAHGLPGGKGGASAQASALAILDAQIDAVAARMVGSMQTAVAKGEAGQRDKLISEGLATANKETNAFNQHLEDMRNSLKGMDDQLLAAQGAHSKYTDVIKTQRDALAQAIKYQRTPAQLAAEKAADEARIARTPVEARARVEGEIAAKREFERNMANPAMVPYAQGIYTAQMAAARNNLRDVDTLDRQKKFLAGAEAEADMEENVAAAYDVSTTAAMRAKAVGEAKAAGVKRETDNEKAYAEALLRRGAATERAQVAEKIANDNISLNALRRLAGTGGNVSLANQVNAENAAIAATAKEMAAQTTMEGHMVAYRHQQIILNQETAKASLEQAIAMDKETKSLEQQIELQKLDLSLKYADAEVRAKAIADLETEQMLLNAGYTKGTPQFTSMYQYLSGLKEYKAYMDAIGDSKSVQIMDTFRNGLSDTLVAGVSGFKSLRNAAANFFQQLGSITMQLYIIKPLLNALLGESGSPGGGFLGSLIGNLFGISLGGAGALSDVVVTPQVFGGPRASGGNVDPGKFYLVGENGPEILSGVGGRITPVGSSSGRMNSGPQEIHYSIVVSGNGDKELLQRMNDVAARTVTSAIEQNNKVAKRVQRGSLINSTKRALV